MLELNFQNLHGSCPITVCTHSNGTDRGFFYAWFLLRCQNVGLYFCESGCLNVFWALVYLWQLSACKSWCSILSLSFPFSFPSPSIKQLSCWRTTFVFCRRNGILLNFLLNTILNHLERKEMQRLRSWLVKLVWRSLFEFPIRYTT